MTPWETEDEYAAAAAAQASLPKSTNTRYRSSSRASRRQSRQSSKSPAPSSSPPPFVNGEKKRRGSQDVTNDESISVLDPRRFTPTLHANLVSEILALRRDQEEKNRIIENLESDLHLARGVHEELDSNLVESSKENRILKRQLTLLEGGSSTALSELARERDVAVESGAEHKRRIESLQKKLRSREDDSQRSLQLWKIERDNWAEERRKLERRIHVAESRLKTVLEEVATYETQAIGHVQQETGAEEPSRDPLNGQESDGGSIRTMSMTNSIRFSMLSGYGCSKPNGLSLADELDWDGDEDQTDRDGRESVMSIYKHRRNQSRESTMSRNHHRNQSREILRRSGSAARGRIFAQQAVLERFEGGIQEDEETVPVRLEYADTGVQCSPPRSPELSAIKLASVVEISPVNGNGIAAVRVERFSTVVAREWEVEANQRRKRVHVAPPEDIDTPAPSPCLSMVSSAAQTLGEPPSPPRTPILPFRAPSPPASEMISMSTQTDAPEAPLPLASPLRAAAPAPIPIPSIQLHPPSSAPSTPREPLLPQHYKDAECQVAIHVPVPTRSTSVQTEEIRVAQRINLLPAHLHPSNISSSPPPPPLPPRASASPEASSLLPCNLPPRNPRRMLSRTSLAQDVPSSPPLPSSEIRDAYPGSNDNGPLSKDNASVSIRRPHRISSLFAGFDNASSDDADDFADGDLSDYEYSTALSAPRPRVVWQRRSKRASTPPISVAEHVQLVVVSEPYQENIEIVDTSESWCQLPSRPTTKTSVRQLDKPLALPTSNKPSAIRRAALIQSGVAAHQGRSRSPILPEAVKQPPFPIPNRASSRRPPASATSDGNRSPTLGRVGLYKGTHYRTYSVRKIRSAGGIPKGGRGNSTHRRGRSPTAVSAFTEAPGSPQLPPMPRNPFFPPRNLRDTGMSRYRSHKKQQPSTATTKTFNTTNTGHGSATSVVNAISQTMVGEWMFKYVRRRKSFGVAESNGMEGDNANGVRHKRWVWLAPYERAVMWNSKQPTSGSALMGKTGRKLTIQSVLDVKDDNPPPRGSPPLFNRSILILTPARALKFTAPSPERHYIWLTALSFLAHSSQAIPEIVQAPFPLPQTAAPEFELPRRDNRPRKKSIRDSIRVAKGRTSVARYGPTGVQSSHRDTSTQGAESIYSHSDPIQPDLSAEPPVVSRWQAGGLGLYNIPPIPSHTRKRSTTGGRVPPPLSIRGFSGPLNSHAPSLSTASMSVDTSSPSEVYQFQPPSSAAGYSSMSASGRSLARTSDVSNRPGAIVNNFFDAVGTMRMEAFVGPMASHGFDDFLDEQDEMELAGTHPRHSTEKRQRSRSRESFQSHSVRLSIDFFNGAKISGEEDDGQFDGGCGIDPFRGF